MPNEPASAAPATRRDRPKPSDDLPWSTRLRVLSIWLAVMALATLLLVVRLPFSGQVMLQVGDVAPTEVVAPRQVTYASDILTEQRRAMAASAVPNVYDAPQARVGREQLAWAGRVLDFIAAVRSDSYADAARKAAYLSAIQDVDLSSVVIDRMIALSAPAWERVATEVQVVLERTMREEIREDNLADERRKVPARVSLDLPEEDAAVVSALVQNFLRPNSFYNAERTEQRRQSARDAVEPVTATLERGETILRAGDVVTDLDVEALRALGLQQSRWSWPDLLAAAAFVFVIGIVLIYFLWRQERPLWISPTDTILLFTVFLVFLVAAKTMIPARALLPYLFPYAALTMVLAISLNFRVALAATSLFVLVVGWLSGGSLELMVYGLAGSLIGTLKLRRGDRLGSFAWAALYVGLANLIVIGAFRFNAVGLDVRGWLELSAAAIANSLIVITVTLLATYLIGAIFGIVTPLQLLEISRPTHPLQRQLLLKAPGTYHHTLIVSNMAERAAEAIGADALLTRVGAYYHDVGKTIRPYFFVENRTEGMDPHVRLDPRTSAQIIITHVKDGMDLARKYRLPKPVIDFIPQHQGTMLVSFFYHQAVQQAGSPDAVDKAQFSYPGPKPQSRETGIAMLADGAEATVRSKRPTSVEELEQVVAESIRNRLLAGQLDECPLTLADLSVIQRVFVDMLRGLHHPRIAYPGSDAAQQTPAATSPAQETAAPPSGSAETPATAPTSSSRAGF